MMPNFKDENDYGYNDDEEFDTKELLFSVGSGICIALTLVFLIFIFSMGA